MLRQKIYMYHDHKVVGKCFNTGEQVLVYDPRRQVGRSSKLMSFWYGPYVIVEKHTVISWNFIGVRSLISNETKTYNLDLEKEKVENDADEPLEEALKMVGDSLED